MTDTTNLGMTLAPAGVLQPDLIVNPALVTLDASVAGTVSVEFTADANRTLIESEYQTSVLVFTDSPSTLTAGRDVVFPAHFPRITVFNNTAQTLTLKKSGQTGVAVTAGSSATVVPGETDVVQSAAGGGAVSSVNGQTGVVTLDAAAISIADAGGYFTGTTVEDALQELGAAAGGGGASIAVQYIAETGSTADSDPGAGLLKWNNATQASATFLYLDDDTADAVSMTGFWAALDVGGFVYLQHATDQDTWQIWEATGVTDAAGYVKIGVSLLANGGSFADGDAMLVTIEQGAAAGGGLTNWTDAVNTAAPNATIPAASLAATNAAASVDAVIKPKGAAGSFLVAIPDNSATGGNKRGTKAVDLQLDRFNATEVASGANSTLSGGSANTVSGSGASCGGGSTNEVSGAYATVPGGQNNRADGDNSVAMGAYATVRGTYGAVARASGTPSLIGESQSRAFDLRTTTSNNTQTTLTTDGGAAGNTNQIRCPLNFMSFMVKGTVNAYEKATGDSKTWEIVAHIKRDFGAGSTVLVGSTVTALFNTGAGTTAWAVAMAADTANGALNIKVAGETSKQIRWNCDVFSCNEIGWS